VANSLTLVEPIESPSVEELFRAHAPELGRYLVALVRDRALAEDLLQDTFQDALRAQEQLPRIENPRAWLYGIARHRALRALRGGRRLQRALAHLGARERSGEADEEVVVLLDLLQRELSPELRALVLLRHLHGFRAPELAEMTGLSPEAVRQRLSRAGARLLAASNEKEAGR
jgi:RNA polymerase sigma-70 factor, ECF subfamily